MIISGNIKRPFTYHCFCHREILLFVFSACFMKPYFFLTLAFFILKYILWEFIKFIRRCFVNTSKYSKAFRTKVVLILFLILNGCLAGYRMPGWQLPTSLRRYYSFTFSSLVPVKNLLSILELFICINLSFSFASLKISLCSGVHNKVQVERD